MRKGNSWAEVADRLALYSLEQRLNGTNRESPGGIGLDIDITLADLRRPLFTWFFQNFGSDGQTLSQLLDKYHLTYDVPQWIAAHSSPKFRDYQRSNFHGSLPVTPGAVEGVQLFERLLPIACYATTRLRTVEGITKSWLRQHRFPSAPLVMQEPEEGFGLGRIADALKARKLDHHFLHPLEQNGMRIVATIDDNPEIINNLPRPSPLVIILFGHSNLNKIDRPEELHIVACQTWKEVTRFVQLALDIRQRYLRHDVLQHIEPIHNHVPRGDGHRRGVQINP